MAKLFHLTEAEETAIRESARKALSELSDKWEKEQNGLQAWKCLWAVIPEEPVAEKKVELI